jgi:hypothetical protein
MSQLRTLIWLKWRLFRNAMRSRRAKINQAASILGSLAALVFAIVVALGLGIATYAILSESGVAQLAQVRAASRSTAKLPEASFILFLIFAFLYMLWATLPLSIGGGSQFDPGRLLMYPISLKKLFAIDLVSELASLSSLFAVPAIFAMAIGAGLATGSLFKALVAAALAILLGIAFAKWLTTSIGSLLKRRRTRGETLLAFIGAIAGLSGAFIGQLWPIIIKHSEWFDVLRWTPPGAVATAMSDGLTPRGSSVYFLSLTVLAAYTVVLIVATFWIAQRSVLGAGEAKGRKKETETVQTEAYTGWSLPLVSSDLSALIEKESRYALRNAQLKMLALMPLILLAVRFMNARRGIGRTGSLAPDSAERVHHFMHYGDPLIATGGVLYVFMIISGLACNAFAFDGAGLRTLILSPVQRRKILISKNVVISTVCLVFSTLLLIVNQIVFRDLTLPKITFVFLSFLIFAAFMSVVGNWFSISFPRQMKFGKRMNVSGVAGLLLLPLVLLMAVPPFIAIMAGFLTSSLLVEYVTLAAFASFALLLYFPLVSFQGSSLERHELEILEAVSKDLEG